MGGCTYQIENCSESTLDLLLDESGPFIVYCKDSCPITDNGEVLVLGNHFYKIELPVGERDLKIRLKK